MTGSEEELPVHDARNMDGEEKNYRIIEDGDMAITTFCLSGKRREPEVPHLTPRIFYGFVLAETTETGNKRLFCAADGRRITPDTPFYARHANNGEKRRTVHFSPEGQSKERPALYEFYYPFFPSLFLVSMGDRGGVGVCMDGVDGR